tara:strand:+ start:55 stop:207 length:153 start_codon:yes stop_codon:yes gene_type:complete
MKTDYERKKDGRPSLIQRWPQEHLSSASFLAFGKETGLSMQIYCKYLLLS